jgi:GDP-mannose 6-dehydrogenase
MRPLTPNMPSCNSEISFLCVGTPSLRNGKLDLGHIEPVCREIGQVLKKKNGFHLVVLRSTVLPGTAETIVVPALEKSSGKKFGQDFGVCVNPEFMREGTAVADFLEPAMTVIGAADSKQSGAFCARSTSGLRDGYSKPPSAPPKWSSTFATRGMP